MNRYDLSSKHILFIGGLTGLDKAILSKLRECVFSHEDMNDTSKGRICEFDALASNDIEGKLKAVLNLDGAFDGVVYNIVHSDFRPLQFNKPDIVNQIMNENYGVFIEILRLLKKNKGLNNGASIVAMSSISSIRAMKAKMSFCASKAALDAAVRCLAVELAPLGIRVNSIHKGVVDTDMEKQHIKDALVVRSDETAKDNQVPLGIVKADEIAQAVAFLLSDAVKTMTGTSVVIDGGQSA